MNDTRNPLVAQAQIYTYPIVGGEHLLYALDAEDADLAQHDNWYACIAPTGSFYAARSIVTADGVRVELLHKIIYERKTGGNPARHKNVITANGDLLNCSRENVISVGDRQYHSRRNEARTRHMTGVQWRQKRGKWRVQHIVDGKRKIVGYFDVMEDAQDALETAVHG